MNPDCNDTPSSPAPFNNLVYTLFHQKYRTKPLIIAIALSLALHFAVFSFVERWYVGEHKKTSSAQGSNTFLVSLSRAKKTENSIDQRSLFAPTEEYPKEHDNHRPGDHAEVLVKNSPQSKPLETTPDIGNKKEIASAPSQIKNEKEKSLTYEVPDSGPSAKQAPIQVPNAQQNLQEINEKETADTTYMQHVEYLFAPKPDYPRLSKRLREQGNVELKVFINAKGLPEDVRIHTPSGHERLDAAALNAVKNWKFKPHIVGNKSAAAWAIVPVDFVLERQ